MPLEGLYSEGASVGRFVFTGTGDYVLEPLEIRGVLSGPDAVAPGLSFTAGDCAAEAFSVSDVVSPYGRMRKLATLEQDLVSSQFLVPTDIPIHLNWGLSVESESDVYEGLDELGGGASFVMQLELVDQSGAYQLRALVPAPLAAAGGLMLLAAAGLCRKR